jgi:hypothetical protein
MFDKLPYHLFREKLKRKLEESGGMTFPVEESYQAPPPPVVESMQENIPPKRRQSSGSATAESAAARKKAAADEKEEERERKRLEKETKKEQKVMEKEKKKEHSGRRNSKGHDEDTGSSRRSPQKRGSDGGQSFGAGDGSKLPKLRQKKKLDNDDGDSQHDDTSHSNTPINDSGSIIKRRKRGELQIHVDGGSQNHAMGPPEDTPGSRYRLRSVGPLTSMLGSLESPFGGFDSSLSLLGGLDKHTMFGDPFSAETPGKYFDAPLSKPMSTLTSDSLRFDFDEVVQHFPSPKTGEKLGSSPMRWGYNMPGSTEPTDGQSVFTFPDSTTAGAMYSSFNKPSGGQEEEQESHGKQSLYSKRVRKAYKKDQGAAQEGHGDLDHLGINSPMATIGSPPPVR